jgi:WD40 repeat protein
VVCADSLIGHTAPVRCLAQVGFTGQLVSGSDDTLAILWSTRGRHVIQTFAGHTGPVTCCVVHEDRLLTGCDDGTVRRWTLATGECDAVYTYAAAVCSVAVHGGMLFAGLANTTIVATDIQVRAARREEILGFFIMLDFPFSLFLSLWL